MLQVISTQINTLRLRVKVFFKIRLKNNSSLNFFSLTQQNALSSMTCYLSGMGRDMMHIALFNVVLTFALIYGEFLPIFIFLSNFPGEKILFTVLQCLFQVLTVKI